MKNIFLSVAMLLLIIGCGSDPVAPTFQAAEYFPLHVGDTWKYKGAYNTNYEYTVVSTEVFFGKTYFKMLKFYQGHQSDSSYFRVENERVYTLSEYTPSSGVGSGNKEYIYIDFADKNNSTGGYVRIAEDSILTDVGIFYKPMTISWHGVFDEGSPDETYSPGIGLIKRRETFGNSFDLIYAKVGGKVYQ